MSHSCGPEHGIAASESNLLPRREQPMDRYFFHVQDGVDLPDHEGTELLDWHAAQVLAVRRAGNLISDEARKMRLGEDWSMTVTNAAGLMLFQLHFHITASPATLK